MRDRARVYFDEGVLFGENGAGFERVNLACPKALLKQVLDNIAVACHSAPDFGNRDCLSARWRGEP